MTTATTGLSGPGVSQARDKERFAIVFTFQEQKLCFSECTPVFLLFLTPFVQRTLFGTWILPLSGK
jgi:hypothetical protein